MAGFRASHLAPLAALALAASLPAANAIPAAAATTPYTITNLGSLGFGGTVGSAVNATGQVTGYSYLSTLVQDPAGCPPNYPNPKRCVEHPWHAFLYSNGQRPTPPVLARTALPSGSPRTQTGLPGAVPMASRIPDQTRHEAESVTNPMPWSAGTTPDLGDQ